MLYTSFNPALGAAIFSQYGPQAQAIAIGSATRGATENGKFSALSWDEFSRDLIVAHHFSRTLGVYTFRASASVCVQFRGMYFPRIHSAAENHGLESPGANTGGLHQEGGAGSEGH